MDLLSSSGETLIAICKQKMANMNNNAILLRRWKDELCENRCVPNGHCYQGNCKCSEGIVWALMKGWFFKEIVSS